MPTLTVLAACERVIIDRGGLPSLINVFQRMNVQVVQPLQADSVIPNLWAVFVIWEIPESELNIEYTQHLEVIAPDGKAFLAGSTKFKMTDIEDHQSKNSVNIAGVPVWAEGLVAVNVWLEGFERDRHSYHFRVKYLAADDVASVVNPPLPNSQT